MVGLDIVCGIRNKKSLNQSFSAYNPRMQNEKTLLYAEAVEVFKNVSLTTRDEKKAIPENYIVATHGPALTKVLRDSPETLNLIGIYRVNCSHIGKESDLDTLAAYLKAIHKHVPILIDLQGPKPRIHEM